MDIEKFKKELEEHANPEKAKINQKFFKTGKGEYGEGDVFLGVIVPKQREVSKKYDLNLEDLQELLNSEIHEHRLSSLFMLVDKYKKASKIDKGKIFKFYLDNARKINSWDLVDCSAHKIVGDYLINNYELVNVLKKLARSENLWEKRISVISTFAFINENRDKKHHVLEIAHILLDDEHDLIHKAVGWMLRELGKKDLEYLECFLRSNYKKMPRTMLRYAIEGFPEDKRKMYLRGKI